MQEESERFRAWTQHIYQRFSEGLGEENVNDKPRDELANKLDPSDARGKSLVAAGKSQDEDLLRRRPRPAAQVRPS